MTSTSEKRSVWKPGIKIRDHQWPTPKPTSAKRLALTVDEVSQLLREAPEIVRRGLAAGWIKQRSA